MSSMISNTFRRLWDLRIAGERIIHLQLLRAGVDLAKVLDLEAAPPLRRIMRETGMLLNGFEARQILSIAKLAVEKLEGDLAEVGVYTGGSARLICEVKGKRNLHLFDTFEGLPDPTKGDRSVFWKSQFQANFESVRQYLGGFPNVRFYRGVFPATAAAVKTTEFCFVHLDVDLYESTRAGIEFFYPRLVPGGVLISHDYNAQGVKRAFEEAFRDKPELCIPQPAGSHCLVVKTAAGVRQVHENVLDRGNP